MLLDHCGKGMRRGSNNYVYLSRKVVSVEPQGTPRVAIESYGKSGPCIARKGHVGFPVEHHQTRTRFCSFGDATVEVVIASSFLVSEKVYVLLC